MDGQPSKDPERPGTPDAELAWRRRSLLRALARSAATFLAVLVLYYLLPLDGDFSFWTVVVLLVGIVVVGGLVAWQVRAIVVSRQPVLQAVQAGAPPPPPFLPLFSPAPSLPSQGGGGGLFGAPPPPPPPPLRL